MRESVDVMSDKSTLSVSQTRLLSVQAWHVPHCLIIFTPDNTMLPIRAGNIITVRPREGFKNPIMSLLLNRTLLTSLIVNRQEKDKSVYFSDIRFPNFNIFVYNLSAIIFLPDDVELWIFLIDGPDQSSVRISPDLQSKLGQPSLEEDGLREEPGVELGEELGVLPA